MYLSTQSTDLYLLSTLPASVLRISESNTVPVADAIDALSTEPPLQSCDRFYKISPLSLGAASCSLIRDSTAPHEHEATAYHDSCAEDREEVRCFAEED